MFSFIVPVHMRTGAEVLYYLCPGRYRVNGQQQIFHGT